MSKLHYIIVLFIVLAIATLTYKLSTTIERTVSTADPELRHDPDYFISDFTATMYNEKGFANYYIKAQHLDHFPDDDTIEVKQLEIEYRDNENQTWIATSNEGIGYENIEILHLSGNVIIENHPINMGKKLILHTDKLRIDFKRRHANTETKVKILGINSTIRAVGMDIDLNSGILTLKSRARGRYVPN